MNLLDQVNVHESKATDLGELITSITVNLQIWEKCHGQNTVYKTHRNTKYRNQSNVYPIKICRSNLVLLGSGSVDQIEEEDDDGDELCFLLSPSLDEDGGRRSRLAMATLLRGAGGTSLPTSVAVGRSSSVATADTAPPPDPPVQALFSPTCLDADDEARRIEGSVSGDAVASARREEAEVFYTAGGRSVARIAHAGEPPHLRSLAGAL
jgi:hypothetical protein